ncbi:hypothetical protein NQZ68_005638 [Dissostichus eleginoides]|nr:hypothetical protein NQZ68_005638 [Dissostichus eleginoides]
MAKNINNKMSTMIEILSEIDGGEDAMTRSKTEALPPLQEIGCFRNRSGISSLSRPLPPQSRKRSIIEAGNDLSEAQEPTMKAEVKRGLSRQMERAAKNRNKGASTPTEVKYSVWLLEMD